MKQSTLDTLEKVRLTAALRGINLDDDNHYVIEYLEVYETLEEESDRKASYAVAQEMISLGLTSNDLYEYYTYLEDQEQARIKAEELAIEEKHKRITTLLTQHHFKHVKHRSDYQTAFEFTAFTPEGQAFLVKGRTVNLGWNFRLWLEYKIPGAKKKTVEKHEYDRHSPDAVINKEWPAHWRNNSGWRVNWPHWNQVRAWKWLQDYAATTAAQAQNS